MYQDLPLRLWHGEPNEAGNDGDEHACEHDYTSV